MTQTESHDPAGRRLCIMLWRVRKGLAVCVIAATGVMTMSACGDEPTPGSAKAAEPSTSESATSAADARLKAQAERRLIPEEALGSSWRLSTPPDSGFRMTVCGVDIEPEEPRGYLGRRFVQSELGPYVVQYVRAHRDGLADDVVAKLRAALPSCTSFETKGDAPNSPTAKFVIEKTEFEPVPDNVVMWRMTSQGEKPITQDIALVADGEFFIALVSFGIKPPDPASLTTAVAALPQED